MNNIEELVEIIRELGGKASTNDICDKYQKRYKYAFSQGQRAAIVGLLYEYPSKVKLTIDGKWSLSITNNKKHNVVCDISNTKVPSEKMKDPKTVKSMTQGDCFGTVAKTIYEGFCVNSNYHWDISQLGWFGTQQRLYASNVTEEGYSVWFLAHSSFNESEIKGGRVSNRIDDDGNIIEFYRQKNIHLEVDTNETRVVFVKNKAGQYIFWGLVQPNRLLNNDKERLHKYIKSSY